MDLDTDDPIHLVPLATRLPGRSSAKTNYFSLSHPRFIARIDDDPPDGGKHCHQMSDEPSMLNIAYLAQGKIHVKTGSEPPRTIDSAFDNSIRKSGARKAHPPLPAPVQQFHQPRQYKQRS
jgi:hypothetical protein